MQQKIIRLSKYAMLYIGIALLLLALALFLRSKRPLLPHFIASPLIAVINQQGELEQTELEQFLIGVLAAEMPASFETEALKAQAIAARTYIMNNMDGQRGCYKHSDAVVCCNSHHCQAYCSIAEMHSKWGAEFAANYGKISMAVMETAGQILIYKGQIIDALYFSTCGGHTASADEYWSNSIAYLQGKSCSYCIASPRYRNEQSFSIASAAKRLGVKSSSLSKTLSKLPPRTVREKLGLYSAKYGWSIKGDTVTFRSQGSGHGVGLCQYGADGMARANFSAAEILSYYYSGIELVNVYKDKNAAISQSIWQDQDIRPSS